jgi:type I restriction enzyme S subunit
LLKYIIPLPCIEEQRRILARIKALAAAIADAQQLRTEANTASHVLLASAINEIWKDQVGWEVGRIGDLASTVSGQVDPTIEPFASLPHINGEFMESGTCRLLRNFRTARQDEVTSGKYHFRADTVLYSKIRPYLKKAAYVPFEGVCSADVYAFDDVSCKLAPKFFAYTLIAPPFTAYANQLSGRTRMPKLNQKQLFAFEMRYPSLHAQQEIVAYLDSLSTKGLALRRFQQSTSAELDALLPSVLDRAFKGNL